jgi:hypothetical protein
VVALDSAFRPIWQKLVGSGGAYPRRALLDGATLVVAGDAHGNVYYGDQQSGALPPAHTFVFRIDRATGALKRGDTYDTSGNGAQITSLAGLADGVAIGGYIGPNADFGGGPSSALFASRGEAPRCSKWLRSAILRRFARARPRARLPR